MFSFDRYFSTRIKQTVINMFIHLEWVLPHILHVILSIFDFIKIIIISDIDF